jgi:hypothetical protein
VGMNAMLTRQGPCCIIVCQNTTFQRRSLGSKDHLVGFELYVPMHVIQLDNYVHTNATISPLCLEPL